MRGKTDPANELKKMLFDREKLARLHVAITDAETRGVEVFKFDGRDFFVPYAKYLAEYLEGRKAAGLL